MKIRSGFVSNSSSSSFILKFDKDYNCFEDFKNDLSKDGDKMEEMCLETLYDDLVEKNTAIIAEKEYVINYYDDDDLGSYMEHEFMPYVDSVVKSWSNH